MPKKNAPGGKARGVFDVFREKPGLPPKAALGGALGGKPGGNFFLTSSSGQKPNRWARGGQEKALGGKVKNKDALPEATV